MVILGQQPAVQKEKEMAEPALSEHLMTAKGEGKVSIVILCWDNLAYTKGCIASIQKYSKEDSYQLITINQGSSDETADFLLKTVRGYQDIIISNVMNRGFPGGCNQALKLADCEYMLFMNNDCVIAGEGWLKALIEGLEGNGVVGPSLNAVIPRIQSRTFEHGPLGGNKSWDYVEGWCLFGKRELFLKLDGFDMRFSPGYGEDSDLCFRVRELGQTIKRVNVPVKHLGGFLAGNTQKYFPGLSGKANQLLYEKWLGKDDNLERLNAQNILIRRRAARGDVLMVTPIIRALKKKFPNSNITLETECAEVLVDNPYLVKVEQHVGSLKDYSVVLTPRYEEDPSGNAIDVMAKQCDVALESRKMEIVLSQSHIEWARSMIDPGKLTLAIHTGRVWKSREWPLERFRKVVQHFMDEGYDVLELGDGSTQLTGLGRDFRGRSIKQTAAALSLSTAFVGVDSLPANLAKAVGTPAFIIYGCTNPATRIADADEVPIWLDDLECRGCRNRTTAEFVDCSQPEIYCLTGVSVDMVIKTMDQYIMQAAKPRFFNM